MRARAKKMKANCRRLETNRKPVQEVFIEAIKNIKSGEQYFNTAQVIDVSPTGILLSVRRKDITALPLRSNLSLNQIHGQGVGFTIAVMDTYIEGVIARTKPLGKGNYHIAIDFRDDAPEYWRQALYDILPDRD